MHSPHLFLLSDTAYHVKSYPSGLCTSACMGRIYSYTANTVKVLPFGVVYLCMFGGYSIINRHSVPARTSPVGR